MQGYVYLMGVRSMHGTPLNNDYQIECTSQYYGSFGKEMLPSFPWILDDQWAQGIAKAFAIEVGNTANIVIMSDDQPEPVAVITVTVKA